VVIYSIRLNKKITIIKEKGGKIMNPILSTIIYSIIGIVLCLLGYKIFDIATPFKLDDEIQKGNTAAGVVVSGIFIAVAIIVAASII
jgi:uncharacterized membrane protein YjfL (UPF0719 family)